MSMVVFNNSPNRRVNLPRPRSKLLKEFSMCLIYLAVIVIAFILHRQHYDRLSNVYIGSTKNKVNFFNGFVRSGESLLKTYAVLENRFRQLTLILVKLGIPTRTAAGITAAGITTSVRVGLRKLRTGRLTINRSNLTPAIYAGTVGYALPMSKNLNNLKNLIKSARNQLGTNKGSYKKLAQLGFITGFQPIDLIDNTIKKLITLLQDIITKATYRGLIYPSTFKVLKFVRRYAIEKGYIRGNVNITRNNPEIRRLVREILEREHGISRANSGRLLN